MSAPLQASTRLGVQLALGAGLLILSSALFGALAHEIATGERLHRLDVAVAEWLHRRATPGFTDAMLVITHLHSTAAVFAYGVVAAAWLGVRRRWRALLTLTLALGGVLVVNVLMKLAFQRARPVFDEPLLTLSTYSFPSGHVAGSTVAYGLVLLWLFRRTPALLWRALAVLGAGLAIALVAFTRMYLGVHYLSDVLAAFAEGVAWLTLCGVAIDTYWRRRHRASRSTSGPAPAAGDRP